VKSIGAATVAQKEPPRRRPQPVVGAPRRETSQQNTSVKHFAPCASRRQPCGLKAKVVVFVKKFLDAVHSRQRRRLFLTFHFDLTYVFNPHQIDPVSASLFDGEEAI
jgi:hypothetical protein